MSLTAEEVKKRLALRKAAAGSWNRAKDVKPTTKGGFGPPAPIDGGAARFVGYVYDLTENGDPYFNLKFVVISPAEHGGKQFRISHFINDSQYSTKEDELKSLCSDIQMFGGEGCTSEVEEADDKLFDLLDDLAAEKPFVEFHSWIHTYGKKSKKKGQQEKRAALDGRIDPDEDKEWYDSLIAVAGQYDVEDDKPDDAPPPARGRATAAPAQAAPRGRQSAAPAAQAAPAAEAPARGRRQAAPATNGHVEPAPAAAAAAPARRGGRPAAPSPEPKPKPAADEFVPQVDEHYGLLVEQEVKEGRKTVKKNVVVEVIVTAVDEAAGTCTVEDLQQLEYTEVPFDELQDAPADEIPF